MPTESTRRAAYDEVTVRQGTTTDAEAVADLFSEARRAAVPQMPASVHTDESHREFYAMRIAADDTALWVAEGGGDLLGFALCTATFLDGLYVRPDLKGSGIGTLLLDVVDATHPHGYELWVFESNQGARRLYERRGLVEVERTDGSGNEEGAPDIRMRWDPLASASPTSAP